MKKALLIRCKYPYGKLSQVWLPMDLHKIAASFEAAGTPTDVVDLNLESLPSLETYDHIGIGVIGMPYIPGTQEIAREVYEKTGKKPLIGGQIVKDFTSDEFRKLFPNALQVSGHIAGKMPIQGGIDWTNNALKTQGLEAVPISDVSVATRIRQLPDELLKKYLENDFGFYISQGCKYKCDFCGADKGRPEEFGEKTAMAQDLDALCESAQRLGISGFSLYLSSLDLFQNPQKFREVIELFAGARQKYQLDIRTRGLSRIDSFLNALKNVPSLYKLIPESGLHTVGFGVDGTTERIWREQHKANKSLSDAERVFEQCKNLGITPESLMVTGYHHPDSFTGDIPELEKTVKYSIEWAEKYGAVCRPHVAKECSPGNTGWNSPKWASIRAYLVENPEAFKNLDYLMEATELSHPDTGFRAYVNEAYWNIIDTLTPRGLCATVPLKPYRNKGAYVRASNDAAETYNAQMTLDR
jgi:hypothetical protein